MKNQKKNSFGLEVLSFLSGFVAVFLLLTVFILLRTYDAVVYTLTSLISPLSHLLRSPDQNKDGEVSFAREAEVFLLGFFFFILLTFFAMASTTRAFHAPHAATPGLVTLGRF